MRQSVRDVLMPTFVCIWLRCRCRKHGLWCVPKLLYPGLFMYHLTSVSKSVTTLAQQTAAAAIHDKFAVAYLGINTIINGGPANSPQGGWLQETGWRAQDIPSGRSDGSYCTNKHCQGTYDRVAERHLQPPAPGLPGAESNMNAVTQVIQGVCPVSWTTAQCDAAGQASGLMPRADSYDPRTRSSPEMFEHNRAPCIAAGFGSDNRRLNKCLVTGVQRMQQR